MAGSKLLNQIDSIDTNDLLFVERDLNFPQKISLCFLLYGDDHSSATYILQKLLALAPVAWQPSDLLLQYSKSGPDTWRRHLVEALCIIGARQVIRRLGLRWSELRLHYLPHIGGLTLHIHPLLKSLYTICEQMTVAQSGRLVLDVGEKVARQQEGAGDPMHFNDPAYLEIYLLDWLTRKAIKLGDINTNGSDVQLLIEHLKFNDLQEQAKLLIDTINSNARDEPATSRTASPPRTTVKQETLTDSQRNSASASTFVPRNGVQLSRDNAGICLIINQRKFHRNVDDNLKKYLSPKPLAQRLGTDVDEQSLRKVFSAMGYKVESHHNIDHMEMVHLMRSATERSLLNDSIVVCILSHGFEGAVYGANSIALSIPEIENVLCSEANVYDKHKLLIIQACQDNNRRQQGMPFKLDATTSEPGQHMHMVRVMPVSGFPALRHTHTGSWFIQCLCEALVQHSDSKHFVDILTIVTHEVAKKRGDNNESMLLSSNICLVQNFYLPPRISPS
ncbi:caspase-8 [Drosophila ananassae]|uniref:caspase-8 n=1 Tax=Drosophila ananassae TaxID=7217 RepID=UPI0013A5C659|nr:caspase-8 [Drosophila ananassae]